MQDVFQECFNSGTMKCIFQASNKINFHYGYREEQGRNTANKRRHRSITGIKKHSGTLCVFLCVRLSVNTIN